MEDNRVSKIVKISGKYYDVGIKRGDPIEMDGYPVGWETKWVVMRQDDSGNKFEIQRDLSRDQASLMVVEFEEKGHKQLYWMEEQNLGL